VAFEPRHQSWDTDQVSEILQQHATALRLSVLHRGSPHSGVQHVGDICGCTKDERALLTFCGRTALTNWSSPIVDLWHSSKDVFVYFNNDLGGFAVRDAHRLALADPSGLLPTRVPVRRERR
jgi:uncharacterized protein YecE (DUF72 family)